MKQFRLLAGILVLLMLFSDLACFFFLPMEIAVQWDEGGISNTASRWMIFVFPLFSAFFALYPKNNARNSQWIRLIFILVLFGCEWMVLLNGLGFLNLATMDFRFVRAVLFLAVGGLLIFFGNRLPKYTKKFYTGVKTPWAYANDDLWMKTQRFAGKIWVVSGIVVILLLFVPFFKAVDAVVLFVLLVAFYLPRIYSKKLWEQSSMGRRDESRP